MRGQTTVLATTIRANVATFVSSSGQMKLDSTSAGAVTTSPATYGVEGVQSFMVMLSVVAADVVNDAGGLVDLDFFAVRHTLGSIQASTYSLDSPDPVQGRMPLRLAA